MERTFVAVKPDGVARGLVGEIISRFEKLGLKILAIKMLWPDEELATKHYGDSPEWYKKNGERTLAFFKEQGLDVKEVLGSDDPIELAKMVRRWLFDYLTSGPVVAMVLEGPHAVELVRKHVGHTYPLNAAPGTIRGDYHYESPTTANLNKRAIVNLIHASGAPDEAEFEVSLWFLEDELHSYKRHGE